MAEVASAKFLATDGSVAERRAASAVDRYDVNFVFKASAAVFSSKSVAVVAALVSDVVFAEV
jgi:hypothetical protein